MHFVANFFLLSVVSTQSDSVQRSIDFSKDDVHEVSFLSLFLNTTMHLVASIQRHIQEDELDCRVLTQL